MDNTTTAVRRPVGLWILVGLYSTFILLSFGTQVYFRFWSEYSGMLEAKYEGWTLLDYVIMYYPGILILLGCLGLVMLKRWALYVFGALLALRLREFVVILFRDIAPDTAHMVWPSHAFSLLTAMIAFFYALRLWKKEILRKGVY